MASKLFRATRKRVPSKSKAFIANSFAFIEAVHALMEKDDKLNQVEIAKRMNKRESEISKLFSPGHNITLKTLSHIEDVVGVKLIHFGQPTKIYRPTIIIQTTDLNKDKFKDGFCLNNGEDLKQIAEC